MTHTDAIREITRLEAICFGGEAWNERAVASHIENTETNLFVTLEQGGEVVGYALGNHVLDEGELFRIAVSPEHRGQKFGAALMAHFIEKQKELGVTRLFLEVRSKNAPAIALYRKFGFNEISRRKNYYGNPTDDAVNFMAELTL